MNDQGSADCAGILNSQFPTLNTRFSVLSVPSVVSDSGHYAGLRRAVLILLLLNREDV